MKELKTHQGKLKLFLFLALMLSVLIYKYTISKTIVMYKQVMEMEGISNVDDLEAEYVLLSNKLNKINKLVGSSQNEQGEKNLLKKTASHCAMHKLKVIELRVPMKWNQNGFEVRNQSLKVEGDFYEILKFIQIIEADKSLGNIKSSKLNLITDYRTKKKNIEALLFVQNIKELKNARL